MIDHISLRRAGDAPRRRLGGGGRTPLRTMLLLLAALALPAAARAQQVVGCDFDIDDNAGTGVSGNTIHFRAQAGGAGTRASFVIVNGNTPSQDVDHDGYATACDFPAMYIAQRTPLVNVARDAFALPPTAISFSNFPHRLPSGTRALIDVVVSVPAGTPAGTYRGSFTVRDSVRLPQLTASGDVTNFDQMFIEVEVVEQMGIGVVNANTAATLDSLVIAGRAGERVSAPIRVANLGNASLSDIRVASSDLRSESAVGIVIPASAVSVTAPGLASLGVGDTARLTVSLTIPRGVLGGRYRGTLLVQGQGASAVQIPFILIVASTRGILFENNPVRVNEVGVARIAFNGDPGTTYHVAIFDMAGLLVQTIEGTVFAGAGTGGGTASPAGSTGTTQPTVGPGADYAASVAWPLTNGRGENVASGMYYVVVQSIVNGQAQIARDRLMVIR